MVSWFRATLIIVYADGGGHCYGGLQHYQWRTSIHLERPLLRRNIGPWHQIHHVECAAASAMATRMQQFEQNWTVFDECELGVATMMDKTWQLN